MIAAVALSVLAGLLYAACEPPFGQAAVAFLALVPLLVALDRRRPAVRFLLGWTTGTIACSVLTSGAVAVAAGRYFDAPFSVRALAGLVVPQVYGAPWFGVFALLAGPALRDSRRTLRPLVIVPAAWVACEYLRSTVGHGLPWVLLAHSQVGNAALLWPAAAGGAYAVSFLLMLANVALLQVVHLLRGRTPPRVGLRRTAIASVLLGATIAFGVSGRSPTGPALPATTVALVQGDVPAEWTGSLLRSPDVMRRLSERTRTALRGGASLVVWPENALGFLAEANASRLADVASLLPTGAHLLLGSPRVRASEGSPGARLENAALLVDDRGRVVAGYAKTRLLPFAETWPSTWPVPEATRSDAYVPGGDGSPIDRGDARFGILICSEAMYPDLAAERVDAGATVLVNIANDAWFADTPAISQHFAASAMRAVETNRFLLRVSNLGVSAVVSPRGEIVARADPREGAVVRADVHPVERRTLYTRVGDGFAWLCLAIAAADVALALGAAVRPRTHPHTAGPQAPGPTSTPPRSAH